MAFTKQKKAEMLEQYKKWLNQSQAVMLLQFKGMTMKDIDALRAKVRENGGEVHVVKNTILERALQASGLPEPEDFFEETTAVSFAFENPPALAKIMIDSTNKSEIFKLKGGFLGKKAITPAEIKSLAELPPLPVMRARLLGVLQAPAGRLARTLAEPGRSLASVIRAYAEKQPAAAEPTAVAGE